MSKVAEVSSTLKPNQIVNIYTDYKDEVGYEGKARLITKLYKGDSFFISNESILPGDKKVYTEQDLDAIRKYERLVKFFYGNENKKPTKPCVILRNKLIAILKNTNNYSEMNNYLNNLRVKIANKVFKESSVIDVLNVFDNDYLIKFTQQHKRDWSASVYNYERWLVEFIEDNTGWPINFRTQRNIRFLVKWNPKDKVMNNEISKYTTYNSQTYFHPLNHVDELIGIKKNNKKIKQISDSKYLKLVFDDIKNKTIED
jgi:hypothetical protein